MATETWTAQEWREYATSGIEPRSGKRTALNTALKRAKRAQKSKAVGQIKLILLNLKIDYVEEHVFHPLRKWRFDYAILDKKIAIEYEGIFNPANEHSRHTHVVGYSNDCEKYNEAVLLGWTVLRFTALHCEDGTAFEQIQKAVAEQV